MGHKDKQEIVATVRIIAEGLFDLCTHAVSWILGNAVTLRLVSLEIDPGTGKPKRSSKVCLSLGGGKNEAEDSYITLLFHVGEDFGKPGAVLVKSHRNNEFYLKSITLDLPDATQLYFPCHSWIVHHRLSHSRKRRIFFSNQVYLPHETPPALVQLRKDDLSSLRGKGKGQRLHGQRIYDYALYNDLSNPDANKELRRPVLGNSEEFPYPRRCRTGRNHTKSARECERPKTAFDSAYVPRDERFSALKKRQFMTVGLKSLGRNVLSAVVGFLHNDGPFETLDHIHGLYVNNLQVDAALEGPDPLTKKLTDGTNLEFPAPGVVVASKDAWRSDREFARQRLAGTNPVTIERLEVFPPVSSLDREIYGEPKSSISRDHLEPHLEGLSVEEAVRQKRLFILDYHDALMPYVNRINEGAAKTYASRTIFFLSTANNMLLPVAIELTLPPARKGDASISRVFTPPADPRLAPADWPWHFAKTHVAIIDGGIHQLVSHWLRTHACIEPIIIATRRQLSAMHPVHVLLSPHFKDTMHINALARTSLICAGGKIEGHFFPGKYALEICSKAYKNWRFDEQSLPKDLLRRGMAEVDPTAEHGLKLTIEDYPFAADGLDLWAALEQWVTNYIRLYYKDDKVVREDVELQEWWTEVRTVGHADHADAAWWPAMDRVEELAEAVTIIIWLASALHAAVNFGQYDYSGYMPNSPCMGMRLIPDEGTLEYTHMMANPHKFFLEMVPTQSATMLAMAVLEILAQHLSEEEYLGERKDDKWSADPRALAAFESFQQSLADVEANIKARNAASATLHHRAGPVLLPYTLLAPGSGGAGLTFRGVPNSISI